MTTNETLAAYFSQFGQADCIVMLDRFTGRSRGFGFCTFPTPEEAQRAMNGGQPNNFGGTDHVIDGKATSAKFCEAKQDWGSAPPQAPQVIVARPQVIVARPQVITARPQVQYVTAAQPDPAAANMAMLAAEPAGGYGGAVSSAAPVQQLVQVVQAPQGGQQYAVDYQQQVPQQQVQVGFAPATAQNGVAPQLASAGLSMLANMQQQAQAQNMQAYQGQAYQQVQPQVQHVQQQAFPQAAAAGANGYAPY